MNEAGLFQSSSDELAAALRAENEKLKRENQALKTENGRFQGLFHQNSHGVTFLSLDLTILDINEKGAAMVGYTPEELIGRNALDLVAPTEAEQGKEVRRRLLADQAVSPYSRTFVHRHGHTLIVELSPQIILNGQGDPDFIQVVIQDITQRIRAENALRMSRKLVDTFAYLATLPLELDTVLQSVVDGLVKVLNVPQCSIILADDRRRMLQIAADHPAPGVPSLAGQILTGTNYQQFKSLMNVRDILYEENVQNSPLFSEAVEIFKKRQTHSLLIAPIILREEVSGLIACSTIKEARQFDQEELALVQTIANLTANRIEQTKLISAERRHWDRTKTLQELSIILSSSLNLGEVLEKIGNFTLSLMNVSSCTIMLLEPPDQLVWHMTIGLPEEIKQVGRQRVGEGLSGWVAANRQGLQVENAYDDPRLMNAELRRKYGFYTFLGVPMVVKGELVGVFEIFTVRPRRFDNDEIGLLEAFARQAAVAVENARLFEQVNKRLEELEQLYQAARILSDSLDKVKVLHQLARQLTIAIGVTSAYIMEANEEVTEQTVVAEYWTEEAAAQERISDFGEVYHLTAYPQISEAIRSGQVLIFHEDSDFVGEVARAELREYGVKSALMVPIVRHGRVYGEVELWESRHRRSFTARETKLAQTIAQHAASVIENAQLFEKVQNHAALLETEVLVRTAELEISNEQLRQEIEERKRIEAELQARSLSLATINTLANTIFKTFDLQELVQEATDKLMAYPKFTGVSIFKLAAAENALHLMAQKGFKPEVVAAGRVIPLDNSINGFAVRRKEIVISYDFENDERIVPVLAQMLVREGVCGIAVIPIMAVDEVLGTYSIVLPEGVTLTDQEQEMLLAISSSLGLAMANARYVQQIEAEIKERQQVEEALKVYAAELEASNQELQDFAYVASHDLQEPLRKIQAFGDRLQQRYSDRLDERGVDYLYRMQNAASRMRILIEDLLTFSRVTTAAQPFTWVDMNQIISGVLSDLELRIEETGAVLEIDSLPPIMADKAQMRQLLLNLMGNALKFHQPGVTPVVMVAAHYVQDVEEIAADSMVSREMVQIVVQDNGIGFEEKYQDRIFNLYERLHPRTEYEGTGMGLAICRKIAQRHNGRIEAHSQPGQGAAFIVTLPVQQ